MFSGFVKGVSGFALPLIMFSGFLLFLPQHTAMALIIIPSLVSNLFQIYGLNFVEIRRFFFEYLLLINSCFFMVLTTSQIFLNFSKTFIYGALCIMIFCFLYSQILNVQFSIKRDNKCAQFLFGLVSGTFGGITGQWGPPLVIYFFSQNLSSKNIICYQGIIYSLASSALLLGHINSGIFNATLLAVSFPFVLCCLGGQYFGVLLRRSKGAEFFKKFICVLLFFFGLSIGYQLIFNSIFI